MPTAPDVVRDALLVVTAAAQSEVQAVTSAAPPNEWRSAMFAAGPLIVAEYAPATAELGLEWFGEIRDEAKPPNAFTPTPRLTVTDDDVKAVVATLTESLRDVEQQIAKNADRLIAEMSAELEAAVQRDVASGFWDTVTGNSDDDPDSVGWQRFAREGACKFCRMLAGRGAVYTEATVRFAAHGSCHCVAGPSYDPNAPRADVMQYLGSKRERTAKERTELRAYLNHHFPDAPG